MNMHSQSDCYEQIIRFMEERNASVSPLKTREIADGCEMSVYLTLYYLRDLNRQHIVEPDRSGKGSAIYWHLVN
ncbi:TPA: FaeA/PapI family transcriptional regulator [Escherichia coli]